MLVSPACKLGENAGHCQRLVAAGGFLRWRGLVFYAGAALLFCAGAALLFCAGAACILAGLARLD
jgi:hypothetical protein